MRGPGKAKNLKGKQKQRKGFVKNQWSARASANKGGVGSWFGALGLTKNNLLFQKWKLWRKSWRLVLVTWRCTLCCLLFQSNMALMFILCTNYWHFTFSLAFLKYIVMLMSVRAAIYFFLSEWMAIKVPFSQHHLYFALTVSFDLIHVNISCTRQLFHTQKLFLQYSNNS